MSIYEKRKSALLLWVCISSAVLLFAELVTPPLYALRANLMKDLKRLEDMGHYEQVLFYRKSTMDMVRALHVQLSGVPFDPRMDEVYTQLNRIYGTGSEANQQGAETRLDRRYWNMVNGQKRVISDLLAKAKLTPAQLERLNERVRIYVEDHTAPEFDEMGNFFFRRKAIIFEQTGLFRDASFRRHLTGHYDIRVCVPYYAAIAEEFEDSGQQFADAYRRKSGWYRAQALREFRRSDGDRLLSELQGGNQRKRLTRGQVIEVLRTGLQLEESDARFAAVLNLAELGEMEALLPAARDPDLQIRREVAGSFVELMYIPGLAVLLRDQDEQIREMAKSALQPVPSERGPFIRTVCALRDAIDSDDTKAFAASQLMLLGAGSDRPADLKAWTEQAADGLRPGILAQYFSEPGQPPVTEDTLRTVDVGFRGNERFPDLLRPYWNKEDIFPVDVEGQFLLRFKGMIYLPGDGRYRFYVKAEGNNRATVRLIVPSREPVTIISPKNDRELLYADQCNWNGGSMSRVDFSTQLDLKKGMIGLEIDYKGGQVRSEQGTAGIRLYWSSDDHVMELVPASALFHKTR